MNRRGYLGEPTVDGRILLKLNGKIGYSVVDWILLSWYWWKWRTLANILMVLVRLQENLVVDWLGDFEERLCYIEWAFCFIRFWKTFILEIQCLSLARDIFSLYQNCIGNYMVVILLTVPSLWWESVDITSCFHRSRNCKVVSIRWCLDSTFSVTNNSSHRQTWGRFAWISTIFVLRSELFLL